MVSLIDSPQAKMDHSSKWNASNRQPAKGHEHHLAYYDASTNLPNRNLFFDRLSWFIHRTEQHGESLVLLYITLDQFKRVCHTFGPSVADHLITQVAERIIFCIRYSDALGYGRSDASERNNLFRVDSEEIALLCPAPMKQATKLANKILQIMEHPFNAGGTEVYIQPTIGIASYPADGADAMTLIQCAVGASAQANADNKGGIYFYSSDLTAQNVQSLQMEADLRHAIEEEQLSLFYQPKVDTKSGLIMGMEALLRWQKPDGTWVFPDQFIPLAEETGLIIPLGEMVIKEACVQILRWKDQGMWIPVAVNVSAKQFFRGDFGERVNDIMRRQGVDPQYLMLELTESVLMENAQQTVETLKWLRESGFKISMDDFGTGYSSLSYLKSFPLDELKIDSSFLQEITSNREDKALIAAIICLAHEFALQVVAEGVEEQDQLNILSDLECDLYQGYVCSRPAKAEDLSRMLADSCARGLMKNQN